MTVTNDTTTVKITDRTRADILTAKLTIDAALRGVEGVDLKAASDMLTRAIEALEECEPEGAHTPTLPRSVRSIEIDRTPYPSNPTPLFVKVAGAEWHMLFHTTEEEVLIRIHEIAAAMEAVK